MSELDVDEVADWVAIRRLQSAYADVVTRRAWRELDDLFLPDARIEVDTRKGEPYRFEGAQPLGEFIGASIEKFDFFEFLILNTHNSLYPGNDANLATGRMYMSEHRHEAATGEFTIVYGLYQDLYRRKDGWWWFAQRLYQTMARTSPEPGRDLEVPPFPTLVESDGAR